MENFLTSIGLIMTSGMTWLGDVTTGLLDNEIFILGVGLLILSLFVGLVVYLVQQISIRKRAARKN